MSDSFDVLEFAVELEQGGFTKQQADALAHAMWTLINTQLATKADLALLKEHLALLEERMLAHVEERLAQLKAELVTEFTNRLIIALVLQSGATAVLFKLLH